MTDDNKRKSWWSFLTDSKPAKSDAQDGKPPVNVHSTDSEAGMPATENSTRVVAANADGKGDGVKTPAGGDAASVKSDKPGDGASGDKPGKEDDRPSYIFREPDAPFRPHYFHARAELLGQSPKVLISPEAYKHMLVYVETARKEVGWLGTVTRLDNGDFFIEETFLLEQEVTATETELSSEGQGKLVEELLGKNGDRGLDQVNRLRFWGHSHVRMGTSPSGTDESTMRRFEGEGLPWYVRGIFNKLGRIEFTLYFYDLGFRICDAPWAVYEPGKGIILDSRRGGRFMPRWRGGSYNTSGERPSWQRTTVDGKPWEDAYGSSKGAPNGTAGSGVNAPPPGSDGKDAAESKPEEPVNPYAGLPEVLVPSADLRAAIEIEFKAKVTERAFTYKIFGGFFSKDEKKDGDGKGGDSNGAQPGEGGKDGKPKFFVNQETQGHQPIVGSEDDAPPMAGSNRYKSGDDTSFSLFDWLSKLFK